MKKTSIYFLFLLPLFFTACQHGAEQTTQTAQKEETPQKQEAFHFKFEGNPLVRHIYTADPSARVFNDTLYVYPSHDEDTATTFSMRDWHVFSTTDMENWTDHGVALSLDDLSWASQEAWAPDCIERNGKYYFYYPVEQQHIGVAVSDSPTGPFIDPLGKPLISYNSPGVVSNRDFIDPGVFIDDDGQAYLFMGQLEVNVIKLNEDMISYDGEVTILDKEETKYFFEAIWMHKYNGKYYLSYSGRGEIQYAMADNILGPYTFMGSILPKVNSGTNHHSIVEYKDKWYLFYHNSELYYIDNPDEERKFGFQKPSPHPYRRSICFTELAYNEDGSIIPMEP